MLNDALQIAGRAAVALVDIARDAAPGAAALPLSPAALGEPGAFALLLESASSGTCALPSAPVALRATGIEAPSSNCRNTVFEVAWDRSLGASDAPKTLFVKQPVSDFATRLFANVVGFWKIECTFCRNVAHEVPVAMPEIYAVADKRSRFVLVMEDLNARPGVRLHVNRELVDGIDETTALACLRTLARLHAHFEGRSEAEREVCLPLDLHPFRSPGRLPFMLALNRQAGPRCHRRAPEIFGKAELALYRRGLDRWSALSNAWYREPMTLVHGDSHIGNFFDAGDEMGLIDFQAAHWGSGLRDVVYCLVNSMAPESLERCERGLVDAYCDARAEAGAPVEREFAWEQYRGFTFQVLMTAVVSLGLGSFTDSDAVMRTMLERSVAAMHRLDLGGWIDGLTG